MSDHIPNLALRLHPGRGDTHLVPNAGRLEDETGDARDRQAQPRPSPVGGTLKRMVDIALSMTAIILLLPVITATALLVWLSGRGSVIYRQTRVGYAGVPFTCLKFRTMVADADDALKVYLERNPDAAREWRVARKLRARPARDGDRVSLAQVELG